MEPPLGLRLGEVLPMTSPAHQRIVRTVLHYQVFTGLGRAMDVFA